MIINHNIPALNTYNNLMTNNKGMATSLSKLSSGLRINRAADDAAGLAISEKMRAQIRGLDQAGRNAQDGISLIQTAEGGLNETHSILQRMRELAVQSANDTYTSQDRMEIQKEIDQLTSEVGRIADTTQFNNKNLLDGSTSALVSTDKLSTKVFMRDGLRILDQFGQKAAGGGNYKLAITTEVGVNQVQKTDIFKIKHAAAATIASITSTKIDEGTKAMICINSYKSGTLLAGDCFSLNFSFADKDYNVTFTEDNELTAVEIAAQINSTAGLSDRITATVGTCGFKLEAKKSGENFDLTVKMHNSSTCNSTICFGGLALCLGTNTTGTASTTNTQCTATSTAVCMSCIGVSSGFCAVSLAAAGITEIVLVGTMKAGESTIETARCIGTCVTNCNTTLVCSYAAGGCNAFALDATSALTQTLGSCIVNGSLMFEVTKVDLDTCLITLSVKAHIMDKFGNICQQSGTINLSGSAATACVISFGGFTLCIAAVCSAVNINVGSKMQVNSTAGAAVNCSDSLTVCSGGAVVMGYVLNSKMQDNKETTFNFYQLDGNTGKEYDGGLKIKNGVLETTTATTFRSKFSVSNATGLDASIIGTTAQLSTKLRDTDKFWDASGNFILEQPQTINLVQGDGSKASFTISGADTFGDVRDKLNAAIANQLGQAKTLGISEKDADNFVSFVEKADEDGLEALAGTFVIRSAIAGAKGEISFVGDDKVLNALSLTTIQKSQNSNFNVNVTEIHSGQVIAKDVKIAENNLIGVVHQNVDVQFDNSTGVKTTWNDKDKDWTLTGGAANVGETFVHLADNTMVFHIGANQKQDIGMGIGNMGTRALGIENIQVTSNTLANQAIGKLDTAIGRVSSERSKLGALQNRLDHTINNLSVTAENLTAAESRIRDVDMAKEMMSFTKFQILANAATSMLAQANQMPQSVLQLLR